jgi:hypothetical protein
VVVRFSINHEDCKIHGLLWFRVQSFYSPDLHFILYDLFSYEKKILTEFNNFLRAPQNKTADEHMPGIAAELQSILENIHNYTSPW